MDIVDKSTRSKIMSKIKSRDTSLEIDFRHKLWKLGYRYKLNVKIIGNPDLVFKKEKIAIFLDSCFWHGCEIHCRMPKTNLDYWEKKIQNNRKRDVIVNEFLSSQGWVVIRLWEHDIIDDPEGCVQSIVERINNYI